MLGLMVSLNANYVWDRYLAWRRTAPRHALVLTNLRRDESRVPRWIAGPGLILVGLAWIAIGAAGALS